MDEQQSRKLAVILHADVVGSTSLVQQDETLAHRRMQDVFRRFSEQITAYGGTAHEVRGDALVAEFSRASDAVCAALRFQQLNAEHNATLDDPIAPQIRVGIALGEEVFADATVTGAGVVLAQRVEQLAAPDGVCVTGAIHEAIPQRMPFDEEDLGERELKGFEKPVRVYQIGLKSGESVPGPEVAIRPRPRSRIRQLTVMLVVVALVAAGGVTLWLKPWEHREEPASVDRMAYPLPDKPSIAVLPFDNLSGNPEQAYFVDGLTEDIITELSRFGELFVIARNSTFTYKNKPVKVGQVAEELGVQYVLEGSVRRTEDDLLITAQLVDATTGAHVWAERYEKPIGDFRAIEDELLREIVSTVASRIDNVGLRVASRKGTDNLSAYELVLQGNALMEDYVEASNQKAQENFEQAIRLDSQYSRAYTGLSSAQMLEHLFNWGDPAGSLERARKASLTAIELDDSDNKARASLGWVNVYEGRIDEGVSEIEKAVTLNPSDASVLANGTYALIYQGSFEQAIDWVRKAMRLDPFHPDHYYGALGWALFFLREYDAALREMLRIASPNAAQNRVLAAIYARLGQMDRARVHAEKVMDVEPEFAVSIFAKTMPFKHPAELEFYLDALVLAGLPDTSPGSLAERPSIAVLPFTNMSNDPEQEYFSDGISEDIITDLSQISGLGVIARNSSFIYKGTAVNVQEVGKDLGVGYVLEGSVRKAGDRLRITAQLVDTKDGHHLWAERYDRNLTDIFELQDEIRNNIVSALSVQLIGAESKNLSKHATNSFDAYDLFLKGRRAYSEFTSESLERAVAHYRQAIEQDPDFARAYGALGITMVRQPTFNHDPANRQALMDEALALVKRAVEMDPTSPQIQWALGFVHMHRGEIDEAIKATDNAIFLSPSYADAYGLLALLHNRMGEGEQALQYIETGMELNPRYSWDYPYNKGRAFFNMGEYERAIDPLLDALERNENAYNPRLYLAASYVKLGRVDDAEWEITQIQVQNPDATISLMRRNMTTGADGEHWDLFLDALSAAGLPP